MTPLPWSGSSSRRSAPTGGSTRRATATPSSGWPVSATRLRQEDTFVELPRARRRGDSTQRVVAFPVPPGVPAGRALAGDGGHEQRFPALAPGAGAAARRQVRLHLLPRRAVVLLIPGADRDRRLPDVLLRAARNVGLRGHPAHP